jgi:hypothetical protein
MIAELMIIELIFYLLVFIVFMVRTRIYDRLLRNSLVQKIRAELSNLKTSAPNLKSTSDSNNSTSP